MSQQEVLDVLNKSKKPMTSKEIANILEKNQSSVNASVVRLERSGDIEKINKKDFIKNFKGGMIPFMWKLK